jgi:hypothetical protein
MCLVTNTPIPTILDKDLVVYKVLYKLGSRIYSIYQDYKYDVGKIYYEEEIGIEPNNIMGQKTPDGYCVYEAYHACTTLDRANDHIGEVREYRIYKCIIPKGSKVFFDRDCDDIASDTIIIKRRLWFNRW